MIALASALVCLAACLFVVFQVRTGGPLVVLDGFINASLLPLRIPPVIAGFTWLTQIGTGAAGSAMALVASSLLWSSGRTGIAGPFWLSFLGAEATTWSLKFITARARPPFLDGVTAGSPSFPSAHATVSMVIFGFLALVVAQNHSLPVQIVIFTAAGALIFLISFSRMLLSLHYFTDVVAGGLIGVFWLIMGWRLMHR